MKIENKMFSEQSFNELAEGDAFVIDNEILMKTPLCRDNLTKGSTFNAVSLATGEFYFISGNLMVIPVNATVVVERG